MSPIATAREALLAEALGEVALLLDRVEALQASTGRAEEALIAASAHLAERLVAFEPEISAITHRAKVKAVAHIAVRTQEATQQSIDDQGRAMSEAARLAFSASVRPAIDQLLSTTDRVLRRMERSWDAWLTHAATAAISGSLAWLVAAHVVIGF